MSQIKFCKCVRRKGITYAESCDCKICGDCDIIINVCDDHRQKKEIKMEDKIMTFMEQEQLEAIKIDNKNRKLLVEFEIIDRAIGLLRARRDGTIQEMIDLVRKNVFREVEK